MKSNHQLQSNVDEESLLAELLEEYTIRLQNGEKLNADDFISCQPGLAEELRRLLPAVHLLAVCGSSGAEKTTIEAKGKLPSRFLGEYRLLREIGRGGMGIVYEAEQGDCGRRVAVKVLSSASHLDSRQLRRFQIEAEAASALHHPHIVPVFDVGSDHGVHYYAMQLIQGQSLDQLVWRFQSRYGERIHSDEDNSFLASESVPLLRTTLPDGELRLPVRTVVRLAVQAALALEHAHQQGVVHRDIKPGNLMVNPNRDHLWITDFGLARCQGDSDLTRTGDLLGTLRYMSPEQALARPGLVDHRTDIYALGATLYELLTLRPVFPGETKQELLKQVADQEPLPLRRHIDDLPVDIETIVLKSLAKNPSERYATAQDLAEDLQRFLEDRPIHARRASPLETVWKWGKRHRGLVTSAAIAGVVLFMAQSISTFVIVEQRNQVRQLEEAARSAVDDMYVGFVQEWLSQKPLLESEQQALLMKALHFYEGLAAESGAQPHVRLGVAHAHHCVADIHAKLGHQGEALAAYEAALTILNALEREKAGLPGLESELAGCWNDFGNLKRNAGQFAGAESAYQTARVLYARQANGHPEEGAAWIGLAGCSANLGAMLGRLRQNPEAESLLQEAIAIDRHWVTAEPQAPSWRFSLASALGNLAEFDASRGNLDRAESQYEEALKTWAALAIEYPERVNYRQALIGGRCALASLLKSSGSLPQAEKQSREAVAAAQRMCEDYPRVPGFTQLSASVRTRLAQVLRERGQERAAETLLRQAMQQLTLLVDSLAEKSSVERELAASEFELAGILDARRDFKQAETLYRQAAEHAEAAMTLASSSSPEVPWLRAQIGTCLGNLLLVTDRRSEGKASLAEALSIKNQVAATNPEIAGYQADLAWSLIDCRDLDQRDLRRAVELARLSTNLRPRDAAAWLVQGATLYRAGRWQEAVAALEEARRLNRSNQTAACYYLALSYQMLNVPAKARTALQQAESEFASRGSNDRMLTALREEARQALSRLSSLPAEPSSSTERTNG